MGTFLDIKTRVLRRLIDAPSQVTAEVPQLVNEAIRHLETAHNFKTMESQWSAVTSYAGGHVIPTALPTNFKEWRSLPWWRSNQGSNYTMSFSNDKAAPNMAFGYLDQGQPQILVQDEQDDTGLSSMLVWPVPDAQSDYSDGEYRLFVPYYRYLPALVNDSDTNWFTVNAEEYIINWAVGQGFMLDWDEQRSSLWQAQMQQLKKEAIQRDKLYRLSGVNTWVPHWQGAATPNLRQ